MGRKSSKQVREDALSRRQLRKRKSAQLETGAFVATVISWSCRDPRCLAGSVLHKGDHPPLAL
jgi:hypothetical protein